MSLLPSRDPTTADADPRVISVDSEDADDVLAALSAGTARQLLAALHEQPAPPGELADRVDTSLQNAQYHLEKLETAGAVEVVDTAYSEKGREMDVYAPANQPLVICAGDERDTSGVRSALASLLGSFSGLIMASILVQELFGRSMMTFFGPTIESGGISEEPADSDFMINGTETGPSGTPDGGADVGNEAAGAAADAAGTAVASIEPGLAFFAGGLVVLVGVFGTWYLNR